MNATERPAEVRRIADPDEMHELGLRLGRALRAGDLVLLTGPLGAGKTTLTRGIGEGLGVRGPIQSPTFVLARTHPSLVGGAPLIHVDAYRLAGGGELDDLDLDFAGSVVVAEWGVGMIERPESWLEVVIERRIGGADAAATVSAAATDDPGDIATEEEDWSEAPVEARTVTVRAFGPRWGEGVPV